MPAFPSHLTIRPMTLSDIAAVLAIETRVYPTPFSATGYQHELTQNQMAHYFVLEAELEQIVGYVGYLLMLDEGHISIISIDPDWQGNGLGELLLVWALREMVAQRSILATLEVRESNKRAQQLYQKYGFVTVGRRKRYYRDTNEDALIMTVDSLEEPTYQACLARAWVRVVGGISAEISTPFSVNV